MAINQQKTGRFIKNKRTEKGYSQQKLAEMLDVEPQTVSKWERGLGMPDYGNLDRLCEIFGCSIEDILNPAENGDEDDGESHKEPEAPPKPAVSFFQCLFPKKAKARIVEQFGEEYAPAFGKIPLLKNVKKKRTTAEYETLLTQGMFQSNPDRVVLGAETPWLYIRVFAVLFIASFAALIYSAVSGDPSGYITVGALGTVVPMLLYLFEMNYSRDVSLFSLCAFTVGGGALSLVLTLLLTTSQDNVIFYYFIGQPLTNALSLLIATVLLFKIAKPQSTMAGLLIGFAVGAGFEILNFVSQSFITYMLATSLNVATGEILVDAALTTSLGILGQNINAFFSGYHFFGAFLGAFFMMYKKKDGYAIRDIFSWRMLLVYLYVVVLEIVGNLFSVAAGFDLGFVGGVLSFIRDVGCLLTLVLFLRHNIYEKNLNDIYEAQTNSVLTEDVADETEG